MTEIQKILFSHQDKKYGDFSSKLIPTEPRNKIIGIRTPEYKKILLEINELNSKEIVKFLYSLPHDFHEENALHICLINKMNYEEAIMALEKFLPYISNWAISDSLRPKSFAKNKDNLIFKIQNWISDSKPYTQRVGILLLMKFYLDEDFKPEYLELPSSIRSNEYYVNMMIAWFFAEALFKQWDATIPYILNNKLDSWTHNKSIQKAIESRRITDSQKKFLRELKIKSTK